MSDSAPATHHATSAPVVAPRRTWRLASSRSERAWSIVVDQRAGAANGLLLALLAIASVASLCLGSVAIAPLDALRGLFGMAEPMTVFVIRELRLARLIAGLLTGAGFALAGVLMQTLARNRLATPGIIGVDNGATAFAVASVVGTGIGLAPPAMALAGASLATAITFGLAGGVGTRGYRFIIAGIGVGAAFGAITQLMLARAPIDSANAAYPWTVGSLNGPDATAVMLLAAGLAVAGISAALLSRSLNVVRFSDTVAQGLGITVARCRMAALALAVLVSALAVAVAGPVGLVALMGPEIARWLSSHRGVPLTASALAGALIVVVADLVGRVTLAPIELPVGLVTTVVGAPFLLWILLRPGHRISP